MSMTDPPAFSRVPPPPVTAADAGPSPWQDEEMPRLTVADVALWAKCCEQTVRRAIQANELTAHRWGKEYRMSPAHVRVWYATRLAQQAEGMQVEQQRIRTRVLRSMPRRRKA